MGLAVGLLLSGTDASAQSCTVDVHLTDCAVYGVYPGRGNGQTCSPNCTDGVNHQGRYGTCAAGLKGDDVTFALDFVPPAGQEVVAWLGGPSGTVDLDLVVQAGDCGEDPACVDVSSRVGSEEEVRWVSDGTSTYYLSVDDLEGRSSYNFVLTVGCPTTCDPLSDVDEVVTCSSVLAGTTATASSVLDYYSCGDPFTNLPQPQPESIYQFTPQRTGFVTFNVTGMSNDHDLYVLEDSCDERSCIAASTEDQLLDESVTFFAVRSTTYYIVVEAWSGPGTYTLDFDAGAGNGCSEICDNLADDDGDGDVDCDDSDCATDPACLDCDPDNDGALSPVCGGNDCDDTNPSRYPGAAETCDGVDEDCDGVVDDHTPCFDDDRDGFTEDGGDCDDLMATTNPAAIERCNGVDDDCDGAVDDGTECADDDGDCFCEATPCNASASGACASLAGGDCADRDAAVHPAATEIGDDGVDNDCDGGVDGGVADPDRDGYTADAVPPDCAPFVATVHPGAPELPDGLDNDCDGTADEGTQRYDDDGDCSCEVGPCTGGVEPSCSTLSSGDCDDGAVTTFVGATEVVDNGVDDDCDGRVDDGGPFTDDDGDGYSEEAGDCDDTTQTVRPGAVEEENGVDDDCDGGVDEGFVDRDGDGLSESEGDCDDDNGWVQPGAFEACDGVDNDCDGQADEGCEGQEGVDPGPSGCNCTFAGSRSGPALLAGMIGLLAMVRRRRSAE